MSRPIRRSIDPRVALLLILMLAAIAAGPAAATTPAPAVTSKPATTAAQPARPRASATASKPAKPAAVAATAPRDSTPAREVLRGDTEGTVFRSLTVEGEDRVQVEIERPALDLAVDPAQAEGLAPRSAAEVLQRESPDLVAPWMTLEARQPEGRLGRPWLGSFRSGAVARFRPEVENVERWTLVVADARGQSVARFTGRGKPPREIEWDGRTQGGGRAVPGLTYSHVLEAFDRAGNKRNFVGEGFEIPAYRLETPAGPVLAFTGQLLAQSNVRSSRPGSEPPALLLEAASWINQDEGVTKPVRVTAIARSAEAARGLSDLVMRGLGPRIVGGPARLQSTVRVEPDAPDGGAVTIGPEVAAAR